MEVNTHSAVNTALLDKTSSSNSINEVENKAPSVGSDSRIASRSKIELSDQGKLFQQLEEKSKKAEGMLSANLSPEQEQEVDKSFKALDAILEKDDITEKDEAALDVLSDKIDAILSTSIAKMSPADKRIFQQLDTDIIKLEQTLEGTSERELESFQSDRQMPSGGFDAQSDSSDKEGKQSSKNLNALTAAQLNKLSALLLKKLSSIQLNKLNSSQLNKLDALQINQLSQVNQAKLNASQAAKIS